MTFKQAGAIAFFLCGITVAGASAQTDSAVLTSALKNGRDICNWFFPKFPKILPDYHNACSHYGACLFSEATKDTSILNSSKKIYKSFLDGGGKAQTGHVDANVQVIVPFELYRQTKDSQFLAAGKRVADDEFSPANPDHLRPDTLSTYSRLWVDDMYMIGSLQCQAYRSTKDEIYMGHAARTLVRYIDSLQEESGNLAGLFYHKLPEAKFVWGRGNGWAASSMAEVLLSIPQNHHYRARIMKGYLAQMKALVKFQDPDGMWHQLLDEPASYKETSCTGMFIFALSTGVHQGWLTEDSYKNAAKKGWMRLTTYFSLPNGLKNVCIGTNYGTTKQYYLDRPTQTGDSHGTAGFIWGAVGLVRLLTDTMTVSVGRPLYPARPNASFAAGRRVFDLLGRSMPGDMFFYDKYSADARTSGIYVNRGTSLISVDGR